MPLPPARIAFVAALFALAGASDACAYGALAVGRTDDYSEGYSIGIVVNAPDDMLAQRAALGWCRNNGSPKSRQQCKVIEAFRYRCVVEANDPNPGTSGGGWGVGDDPKDAGAKAMEMCLATAGEDRRLFCRVVQVLCDQRP